ncbi:glycoside hydrolase family 76 protein [Periconia macrospinosa]|uniref:Glycoside hydrolase family 76 protein n=1 Tax=Periconia macrospinosa TaxID=97972 RepID=A0A2V1DUX4_9PLEO|nr:glycoside hydrolase family 76 protein [Periconia macrospinosa]
MYSSTLLLRALPLLTILAPNTFAQSTTDPIGRAELALQAIQVWYNAGTGLWDTSGWWNSANAMTMIGNLAKADSNPDVKDLAVRIFANTLTQAPAQNPQPGIEAKEVTTKSIPLNETGGSGYYKSMGTNDEPFTTYPDGWLKPVDEDKVDINSLPINSKAGMIGAAAPDPNAWLDGFYDDDLWWALAWANAYDITGDRQYLDLASGIFKAVTKSWPSKCGNGGIYWSWEREYVNAIANELFFSTAAHLANRVPEGTAEGQKGYYVDWANRALDWFVNSGMINERGTINDGLTDDCKNNNRTTWSYNQGVILGGLVELNRASPNPSHLTLATRTAKAAIAELADENGILHDKCGPTCGPDASQFKGIFARGLQALQAAAPDELFDSTIKKNADSVWNNDREEATNRLSINWAGPVIPPANATTHSSAMEVLVADVAV